MSRPLVRAAGDGNGYDYGYDYGYGERTPTWVNCVLKVDVLKDITRKDITWKDITRIGYVPKVCL